MSEASVIFVLRALQNFSLLFLSRYIAPAARIATGLVAFARLWIVLLSPWLFIDWIWLPPKNKSGHKVRFCLLRQCREGLVTDRIDRSDARDLAVLRNKQKRTL